MNDSGNEIERAWIFNPTHKDKWRNFVAYNLAIIKHDVGYLVSDEYGEVRILKKESYPSPLLIMTVKSRGDLSRKEWETLIPQWVFDQMWARTYGSRLSKMRLYVPYHLSNTDYVLETDVYQKKLSGLLRIECEFSSEEEASRFTLPLNIRDCVYEVTNDVRFKNKNLATNGLPEGWQDVFNNELG